MWAWVRLVQKWEHVVKRCESMVLFTRDTTKLRANASHVNVGQRINKRDNESITTPPRYERYWKYLKHLVSFACIIRLTVFLSLGACAFLSLGACAKISISIPLSNHGNFHEQLHGKHCGRRGIPERWCPCRRWGREKGTAVNMFS